MADRVGAVVTGLPAAIDEASLTALDALERFAALYQRLDTGEVTVAEMEAIEAALDVATRAVGSVARQVEVVRDNARKSLWEAGSPHWSMEHGAVFRNGRV